MSRPRKEIRDSKVADASGAGQPDDGEEEMT